MNRATTMLRRHRLAAALWVTLALPAAANAAAPGRNEVNVRGQGLDVYYYPAAGAKLNRKVLFAPGDGGWRGWAVTVAQQMASWGYDVYGFDTRDYLTSFTGRTRLKESDVMSDFRQVARWVTDNSGEKVTLVGWSEGAGLSVLAAANGENKGYFNGVVTFGLGDANVLGWTWQDTVRNLAGQQVNEPQFQASRYMAAIAPLRLLMIHAGRDEYVPLDEAQSLLNAARGQKRLTVIQANDHKFTGNTGEFYRVLREGLQWVN
jgi:dienelactone hydrolase